MRLTDKDIIIEELKQEIVDLTLNGMKGTPQPTDELRHMIDRLEDEMYAPTIDAIPWIWLEAFAKTKTFKDIQTFIEEAKEMCVKMQNCCCF